MSETLEKDDKPEDRVRHTIQKMGGNISEKIDLYEFMETGRGVIANKQVYNFEKIILYFLYVRPSHSARRWGLTKSRKRVVFVWSTRRIFFVRRGHHLKKR